MNINLIMWLVLLGLEITLHFLDKHLTILVSLGVMSIYSILFFAKEVFSSIDVRVLFYSICPITVIYLYFCDISIWWIVAYIILAFICYRMIQNEVEIGLDIFIIITVLSTWMLRDIALSYKIAAPILLLIAYILFKGMQAERAQAEINKSRQVFSIEGHKRYVPQCKKCGSYNTIHIRVNELSTSYGRTEAYTEARAFRDVIVAKRQRYTHYELQYKCNDCNEMDSTSYHVRAGEYV